MGATLCPYLNFDGNAAEAMRFYQQVLGGELVMQTFGEAIPDTPPEYKDRIMHARLESGAVLLMASDTNPGHGGPFRAGNNVHLSLMGSDVTALTAAFHKLAEGGQVVMPLEKQFWGALFGMVTDKFGVQWMVNIEP